MGPRTVSVLLPLKFSIEPENREEEIYSLKELRYYLRETMTYKVELELLDLSTLTTTVRAFNFDQARMSIDESPLVYGAIQQNHRAYLHELREQIDMILGDR